MTQYHNISPVYDKNSKVLILGSFPSVKSREAQFFYGHPQNRFWKVLSAVLGCECPVTTEEKKAMLLSHNIAVWDVIGSCEITGSSDASIRSVVPNDIAALVAETSVTAIFANGATSHNMYKRYCRDAVGMEAVRLPSTSPANASYSLERLTAEWGSQLLSVLSE
ncbi:MAG: DNA-deoxyinosine glycosylase [Ruminiclostridium sp.]|nr:DNA-deoxyinosine glycosylase [Ruminiclostridium sp.]